MDADRASSPAGSPPDRAAEPAPGVPVPRAASYLASDAEREACVAVLRSACEEGRLTLEEFTERMHAAYAARTDADLDRLVADLPRPSDRRGPSPVAAASGAGPVVTGRPGTGASVAVMSGCERKGVWACSRVHSAVAVMGGVELDFRHATLEAAETEVVAVAIMGGIDIVVPEGWDVRVSGFSLMGGTDERVRRVPPLPGAPVLHVRAYACMGGIDVSSSDAEGRKPSRRELREQRRELGR